MFTTLKDPEENAAGNKPLELHDIKLLVDEVTSIDTEKKEIMTRKRGESY